MKASHCVALVARGHLLSPAYRNNEGNNTRYFFIPTILVAAVMFRVLPFDLFLVMAAASTGSFYGHVYLLARFAWFRRKRQLHLVHHLHGDSNFAVIDLFWDRLLGTYRRPDGDAR
jgi:sterol desaturase/sphingolipid hydroxylase (fatty acid hydroxylase superfamily)